MQPRFVFVWGVVGLFIVVVLAAGGVVGVHATAGRILPGVAIGTVDVGGMTPAEARTALGDATAQALSARVPLEVGDAVVDAPRLADVGVTVPVRERVHAAMAVGRERSLAGAVAWVRGMTGVRLPLRALIARAPFDAYVEKTFAEHASPPQSAGWIVSPAGVLTFTPAAGGRVVDGQRLARDIVARVGQQQPQPIAVQLVDVLPAVSDTEARALRPAVERLAGTTVRLTLADQRWELPLPVTRSWVAVEKVSSRPAVLFDREKVARYLAEELAPAIDRPPENARFELVEGRAQVFQPPQDGRVLDVPANVEAIRAAAAAGRTEVPLQAAREQPQVTTTADLTRLGIHELLGRGESDFAGSPRNRIHNIRVGAARFHGVLIPPGATFGFNETLGPVTHTMGYKPELVILHNVTAPQYGGGLCQVSTTAFRAAILSGLPITERRNHAYPVSYYGTPGFDATIYPNQRTWKDGTDLKFANDTPNHILIQTKVEGTKLVFEFWGTSDGREVKIVGPSPYGRQPGGAVKATLTQQVFKNGALAREETFQSSYKSPKLFPHVLAENAERETWEERVKRIAEKDRKAQEEFARKRAEQEKSTQHATPAPLLPPSPED